MSWFEKFKSVECNFNTCVCLSLSYIADYVKLVKPFGGIRVKNEKMELIDNKEFQTLYDKSKKTDW